MSLPHCPKCNSEYTYEDNGMFICPECAHEWNDAEPLRIVMHLSLKMLTVICWLMATALP
jgi:protein PhnA